MDEQKNKEIFARNLLNLLSEYGLSQAELADRLKIPRTTMSNWIKGNTYPRVDKIQLLADFFDVMKSDLTEDRSELQHYIDSRKMVVNRNPNYMHLLNASAGIPSTDYADEEEIEIPSYLAYDFSQEQLFAIRVVGESMNKKLPNGSIVICSRLWDKSDIKNGDIVVFKKDNEYCIKRFIETSTLLIFEPVSFDSQFQPVVFNKSQLSDIPIEIMGTVRYQFTKF